MKEGENHAVQAITSRQEGYQIGDTVDNVWSLMFHTGYLTMKQNLGNDSFELCIPNGEVLSAF